MSLAGRPLVEWSIAAFRAAPSVRSILVACPLGHVHDLGGHDLGADGGAEITAVEGGSTRAQSVSNALEAVDTELVAIHDAARPLLTAELVEEVVAVLLADPEADGAIAATPVTDTIKRVAAPGGASPVSDLPAYNRAKPSLVAEETVDRGRLWAAQTPQVFRTEALRRAIEAYPADGPEPTDEAMLVEANGGRVVIHPGPAENLKVTTPLDLRLAEALLSDH